MEKFVENGRKDLQFVESRIWQMINYIRHEIDANEYDFVLFLLTLYRYDIIKSDLLIENHDIRYNLSKVIRLTKNDFDPSFEQIISIYEPIIQKVSHKGLTMLITELININRDFLSGNFSHIFENILFHFSRNRELSSRVSMQPLELTRLMLNLAELEDNSSVYNPFAGLASFLINSEKNISYYGQEISERDWSIGMLRIFAQNKQYETNYICEDSILNWKKENKYDIIISTPPFGFRLRGNHSRYSENQYFNVEQFLLGEGVKSLSSNGKLIALLPQNFLYSFANKQLRESLINNDLVDIVISLPFGLLLNSGVSLCIVVINKNKANLNKVKIVQADNYIIQKVQREIRLNDTALYDLICDKIEDEDAITVVDNSKIKNLDYNLSTPLYFEKPLILSKNERLYELSDILVQVNGERVHPPIKGKLTRVGDLKDDRIDYLLNIKDIELADIQRRDIKAIKESCLLLSSRFNKLKPTFFNYESETLYKSQDIYTFQVNEKLVDTAYLINELHAEYIKQQVKMYSVGSVMSLLRREDLLKIKIRLPSLSEQRATVKGMVEISEKIKQLEKEKEKLSKGAIERVYASSASIKHSLGKPLLSIGSSLRNIRSALYRLDSNWENYKLSERHDVTLKATFNNIFKSLELANNLLLKFGDKKIEFSQQNLSELDFIEFINNYFKRISPSEKPNVDISLINEILINDDEGDSFDKIIKIKSNILLLELLFNNIIDNAYRHAFIDDFKKYRLEISVSLYIPLKSEGLQNDRYIKVDISNNGVPFPNSYTKEMFLSINTPGGKTGNTGLGGFEIDEIIKIHNDGQSTFDLILNDKDDIFTTIYSFLLPIM